MSDRVRFKLVKFVVKSGAYGKTPGNVFVDRDNRVYISFGDGYTWNIPPTLAETIVNIRSGIEHTSLSDIEIEVNLDSPVPRTVTNYWYHTSRGPMGVPEHSLKPLKKFRYNYNKITNYGIF